MFLENLGQQGIELCKHSIFHRKVNEGKIINFLLNDGNSSENFTPGGIEESRNRGIEEWQFNIPRLLFILYKQGHIFLISMDNALC